MKYSIVVRALLPTAILCVTAASIYGAANGWVETFENGLNGWLAYDMINEKEAGSLTIEAGIAVLSFPAQSIPMPPEEHVFRAEGSASDGAFVGDYTGNGISALALRVRPESDATIAVLIQNTPAQHRWRYDLAGLTQGEWNTVIVPLRGELAAVHCGGSAGTLETDLQNVSWVGVLVKRGSDAAQRTCLDDVRLLKAADVDYQSWMAEASAHNAWQFEMLPDADLDGDGMANIDEFTAGTDGTDEKDFFCVSSSSKSISGEMELVWKSVEGRTYRVLRSEKPWGPYVPIKEDIVARPPENRYIDKDSIESSAQFYRIEVRRSE